MSKRMIGVEGTPPHLVVCVPSVSQPLISHTLSSPSPHQPHSVTPLSSSATLRHPLPSLLHLQVVIPLSAAVDCQAIHSLLCGVCEEELVPAFSPLTTLSIPSLKQRFTFAFPPASNLYAVLDVAKVCTLANYEKSIYLFNIFQSPLPSRSLHPPPPIPLPLPPLTPSTSSRWQTLYYWFTMLGRGWTP